MVAVVVVVALIFITDVIILVASTINYSMLYFIIIALEISLNLLGAITISHFITTITYSYITKLLIIVVAVDPISN